jgi:hypothetical protein
MLWVSLEDGKVASVGVKRYGYWLVDEDIGVYGRGTANYERPEFQRLFPE